MSYETEDIFRDLKENCQRVKTLLEEESKLDPDKEPYKTKYAVRTILNDMNLSLATLKTTITKDSIAEEVDFMSGAVSLMLGVIATETEEFATGEEHLVKSLNFLDIEKLHPKNIVIFLKCFNLLGLLWSQRSDNEKALSFLLQAEQLYIKYCEQCDETPVDIYDLFIGPTTNPNQTKGDSPLEKEHTLTLYYLAQAYGTQGETLKSSIYCHSTLKRQLESTDFDKIEWALNCATLAQFFMEKNAFHQARHHLAAASHVLNKYESEIQGLECLSEEHEAKKERIRYRGADIARCWAKYGIVLLNISKDRLMTDEDNTQAIDQELPEELTSLQFNQLELSLYEDQVTDSYVLTFEDARAVFHNAQTWLSQAKLYYTLIDHASDHVRIVQDHSELYKNLIFFEDNYERQCKMHKRRINLLNGVVKELNPTYYLTSCRELWFELGEIYLAMIDIKWHKLMDESKIPTPHFVNKINYLVEQGIAAYNQFLDSLKDHKTKQLPDLFSPEMERPALLIYFYLGRLHNKYITYNDANTCINVTNSLKYYQELVDYCAHNESAKENMSIELNACLELIPLLKLKLKKFSQ